MITHALVVIISRLWMQSINDVIGTVFLRSLGHDLSYLPDMAKSPTWHM